MCNPSMHSNNRELNMRAMECSRGMESLSSLKPWQVRMCSDGGDALGR
jgi:hypothetical protein